VQVSAVSPLKLARNLTLFVKFQFCYEMKIDISAQHKIPTSRLKLKSYRIP